VCIADAENYSIIDLENAHALPLLPISQVNLGKSLFIRSLLTLSPSAGTQQRRSTAVHLLDRLCTTSAGRS
jgi:hypothetical protein